MNTIDKFKVLSIGAKLYLKRDFIIKNWKTTLVGFVSGVVTLLATVDFNKPVDWKDFILPVLFILWGVVQKDGNVTGGNVN
jgi:uncharacterized membrane protein HdeD (DUF308 family)